MAPTSLQMDLKNFGENYPSFRFHNPRCGWIRAEQTLDVFNRSIMLCVVVFAFLIKAFDSSGSTTSIDFLGHVS
jgi:hypothetical protein